MNLFSSLITCVAGSKANRQHARTEALRRRPTLERLEDRCLPSTVTELPVLPTAGSAPTGIVSAADGSVWFTERSANKLGRLDTHGVLTEYAVPTASSAPEYLTATPDGNVWFTERYGGKIGRTNQGGGAIAEFTVPGVGAYPTAITTLGSGAVWFASVQQPGTARLGSISSTGSITMLPTAATRTTITSLVGGPDGNLWVTEVSTYWGDSVAKVTTTGWGSFTNYRLANHHASPQSINVGPDNNLWFTESSGNSIGRITTGGAITEFALPIGSTPQQIVSGPDGALWFTEKGTGKIGRMTATGRLSELALASASSQPFGITRRQDGTLWFTEQSGNCLGKVMV
jgi:virginiamycin B lyase